MNNYYELDESEEKYSLKKLKPKSEEWLDLWTKNLLFYDAYSRFWKPRLDLAKKCMNYMRREIFTYGQRIKYKDVQKKIPIEPQEMKPVITSLCDQIKKLIQSFVVTMEDETPPENAAQPEVVNLVLKWLKTKLKYERKKKKALRQGLITGYPQWIWYDMVRAVGEETASLKASLLPWDSTLCSPYFEEEDGSDIDDIIRVAFKTKHELLEQYPDRKKALKEHEKMKDDPGYIKQLLQTENNNTSEERKGILYNMLQQSKFDSMEGFYFVAERVFPIEKSQTVQINPETQDVILLPPEWKQERKDSWLEAHPEYSESDTRPIRTLWTTTIDTTGFIWENGGHWYQNDGGLPGKTFIADMIDRQPTGAGDDMLPYILAIAVAKTEGLDQVRKGTGTLTIAEEGALKNPKHLNKELSKANGVVIIRKKAKSGMKSIHQEKRTPNTTFLDYEERERELLKDVHNIHEAARGVSHPRQSKVAKTTEIEQGMAPQSSYIDNYSNFDLDNTQLLCNLFPYALTENQIIEIKDEYGNKNMVDPATGKEPEINVPGFDYSGQASIIANDLTSAKYRITPVASEDTPTSREKDLKEFVELLEAVGNTLFQINPKLLANILATWPNRYAKEAGKFLLEYADQAQQSEAQAAQAEQQLDMEKEKGRRAVDMEKIKRPKISFKFDPKDLEAAPQGAKIMFDILQSLNQQTAPEQAPTAAPVA